MMTVRQYFEATFPGHVYAELRDPTDLESMPLDSNCGDDCRKAIDASKRLLKHVAAAYGDRPDDHPRGHALRQSIGAAVVEVLGCYICG